MEKRDLRKEFKNLFSASAKKPEFIDVPPLHFLMVDGEGDPNTSAAFRQAVGTLYSISYTLKFTCKKELEVDYGVMPLEGLWWTDEAAGFSLERKNDWKWTLMILQPDFIPAQTVRQTIKKVREKSEFKNFPEVRFEVLKEGKCAQILHIGPYSAEGPTIERLHDFIKSAGYQIRGRHHEIYFGDPRRSAPEKLKTIIRQPVADS